MRQTALRVTQWAILASLIFTERQRFCVVHCHFFLPGYNKLKKGTALQSQLPLTYMRVQMLNENAGFLLHRRNALFYFVNRFI